MQLWPAPPAHDAVLRQTSAIAGYWHGVALDTPPPPPPPTATELADIAAAEEAEMLAQQQQFEDARELHLWSGQRPTDQLRAIGWPTPQLARRDRALVDRLAALPPDRQRTIARWAARRACEIAGIDGLDWVAAGLAALDRGAPLPAPLTDWNAVWDRLFPGATVVATVLADDVRGRGPADCRRVDRHHDRAGGGRRQPGPGGDRRRRRVDPWGRAAIGDPWRGPRPVRSWVAVRANEFKASTDPPAWAPGESCRSQ